MGNRKLNKLLILLSALIIFSALSPFQLSYGQKLKTDSGLKYYLGSTIRTKKNAGYSGEEAIKVKDPHYGWNLGSFFINGYTRRTVDHNNNPVFLKNVGDKVALWYNLEQDINQLNKDSKIIIAEDIKGYDEFFELEKQDFGRGVLIIGYTDYQNKGKAPIVYTNFLESKVSLGKETVVDLFEEGDYIVALNYKIKKTPWEVKGKSIIPSYYDYKTSFRFSVRNGNAMVFLFDTSTEEELTNKAFTENGFFIDLANSHYLDVTIEKVVVIETSEGLGEDIRFNRPAKDRDKFTDEGIYTITAKNNYTNESTEKRIYVGDDNLLRAYLVTGLPLEEIQAQIDQGATINPDGTILLKLVEV